MSQDENQRRIALAEAAEILEIESELLSQFIERQWLCPPEPTVLDHEDLARAKLILDLRGCFGANDESIPVILHLVDQVYYLKLKLKLKLERRGKAT